MRMLTPVCSPLAGTQYRLGTGQAIEPRLPASKAAQNGDCKPTGLTGGMGKAIHPIQVLGQQLYYEGERTHGGNIFIREQRIS